MVPEWVPGDVEGLDCLLAALRSPDVGANPVVAHTMLQALLTIPMFWMRRPREETEALVAIALDLLQSADNCMQSVAILDASATWFRNMFASQFGRQIICDQLHRKLLNELREFVKRLPLESDPESVSEVANATAAHNIRCCGFLLESSRGRKVLRETFSALVPEDGVDRLLTAMVSRMVDSTEGTDPVADAVRDVLLGLCREDQCLHSCVYKPSVLAALTSAPENDRALEVLAAIVERPWPTDTAQDFPERLALFVAESRSPSASLARITCRIFASTLTIPEGTVIMDVASASALCATPLGSLACVRLAPSAVAKLFARFRLGTPEGEYGDVCWSVLHGLSQLGGVMPAIGPQETKDALVQELKLCTEGLAERIMAVAETRSSGNSQRPCTDGKLDRAIDRLLLTLASLIPSFPESLELFEPKESTKLWTLISCVLGGEITCEAAYIIALRLLCLLARDLDFTLHLMTHAGLKEALVSTKAIVDESSVLRNRLAVLVSSIGGPSEKLLPPKTLSHVSDEYTWPMVTEDVEQLQEYYVAGVKCSTEAPEGYLREFVGRLRNGDHDPDYMEHSKAAFQASILADEFRVPGPWCGDIFEAVIANVPCLSEVPKLLFEYSVDVEHTNGANLATEYGVRLGLLKEADSSQLASLMSHLHKTQMPQTSRFDWLAATMYLLLEGDVERTWNCIYRLRTCGMLRYLTEEVCAVILYHNVEMILGEELPTVLGAFQVCGVSISSVCRRWLGQCFWNVLSWGGICQWLGLQLLHGEDMAVYHLVSIFAHMKEAIVDNAAHRRLAHFAMEVRIEAFEAGSFLGFIRCLEEKYQDKLVRSFKC